MAWMISELWIVELMIEVLKRYVVAKRRIVAERRLLRCAAKRARLIERRLVMAIVLIKLLTAVELRRWLVTIELRMKRRSGWLMKLLRLLTFEVLFRAILVRLTGVRFVRVTATYVVADHRVARRLRLHRLQSCLTQILQLEVLIVAHRSFAVWLGFDWSR